MHEGAQTSGHSMPSADLRLIAIKLAILEPYLDPRIGH